MNWPAYLHDPAHSSTTTASAITPANAAGLVKAWSFVPDPPTVTGQPAARLYSSPIAYNGVVLISAWTGILYAVDETTGGVLWQLMTGWQPKLSCAAKGTVSTPTVVTDPGSGRAAIYLSAADGYLWSIDELTGTVNWRVPADVPSTTTSDYFAWASPTVISGRVYVGGASNCDNPLVPGNLKSFDQATGALLATFDVVPSGSRGGAIWSSPAASATQVWVSTGNADPNGSAPGYSSGIVRLDGSTLSVRDSWLAPVSPAADLDFGASPTLFTASLAGIPTRMVGACAKDGNFYALRAGSLAAGPVWSRTLGAVSAHNQMCLAAAIWDGHRLFVAANATTIAGTAYPGSVRRLDPATGAPIWETGLPAGPVMGTPSLDHANVLAATTLDSTPGAVNGLFLLNGATGAILSTIPLAAPGFAQPVFADNELLVASIGQLDAYRPGP